MKAGAVKEVAALVAFIACISGAYLVGDHSPWFVFGAILIGLRWIP